MIPTASACPTLRRLGGHSPRYGADEEPAKRKGDDKVGRTPGVMEVEQGARGSCSDEEIKDLANLLLKM